MHELATLILLLLYVPWLKRFSKSCAARDADTAARETLNAWIRAHPGMSLRTQQATDLLLIRIAAREEYIAACPAMDDNDFLVSYLTCCLFDDEDAPAPYPMP